MKEENDTSLNDKNLPMDPGIVSILPVKNIDKEKIDENDENFNFEKKKKKKIFNKNFSKIESKIQETLLVKIKTSKPSSSNIKANDNSNNTFFN